MKNRRIMITQRSIIKKLYCMKVVYPADRYGEMIKAGARNGIARVS